jgi:tape measure domain-containing protein
MAFNMGSLVFRMAADVAGLAKDMNQAKQAVTGFTRSAGSAFKTLAAGATVGIVAKQFVEMSDAIVLADARLRLVTKTVEEFQTAQKESYRIAQQNQAGLIETQTLYQRLAMPIRELGGGMSQVTDITEAFASALRVSGASTQEASSAILQFSQAMQSGRLNGDEFRSLAENSPRFMKALADGIGKPVGALKEMSKEGKLTADIIGNALIKQLSTLKAEAAAIPTTVGGAFQQIKNDALVFTKAFNEATGATSSLVDGLTALGYLFREFNTAVEASNKTLGTSKDEFDLAGLAIAGIGTILETIAVLFANIGYVAKTTAGEIGVRWQQLKLHMTAMNATTAAEAEAAWEKSKQIGEEWETQSNRNRVAIDEFTKRMIGATDRIMKTRDALKNHSLSAQELATDYQRLAIRAAMTGEKQGALGKKTKELTDEQKKAAEAAAKLRTSLLDDVAALEMNTALEASSAGVTKLSDAQKLMLKVGEALRDGKLKLGEAEKVELFRRLELAHNTEIATERNKEYAEAILKVYEALNAEARSIQDEVTAQKQANEQIGLTKQKQVEYTVAIQETKLAKLELLRATPELSEMEERLIQRQIDAQKELIRVTKEGAAKQAMVDAADAAKQRWEDVAKDIEKALTDAMVNGWNSGKSFFKQIGDWIVNYFKTTVARGIAQALTGAISTAMSGAAQAMSGGSGGSNIVSQLLGMFSPSSSGGSGGSGSNSSAVLAMLSTKISDGAAVLGNMLSNAGMTKAGGWLFSNAGAIGKLAPQYAAGIGVGIYGGRALSGGYSAIGGGSGNTAVNIGTAIGMIWGPIGAAIGGLIGGAVNRAFGRKPKETTATGLEGSVSYGGFSGTSYADWKQKGGWFRKDKSGRDWSAVDAALDTGIDESTGMLYDSVIAYAEVLKLPVEWAKNYTQQFSIVWGKSEEENKAILEKALKDFANNLAGVYGPVLKQFQKEGEELFETMSRLASIQMLTTSLAPLGGVFFKIADASLVAREALVELAGGVEAFSARSATYIDKFYSEDEKDALEMLGANRILEDAGIDTSKLGGATKEEAMASYRKAVDSLDPTTEEGMRQYLAYMDAAGLFEAGADILAKTGMNLDQLTAGAPTPEQFAGAPEPQNVSLEIIGSIETSNGLLGLILKALEAAKNTPIQVAVSVDQPAYVEVTGGGG